MLERVQRAWDRIHHRGGASLLYRRVSGISDHDDDDDDATAVEDCAGEDLMTASLYCPGPGGELVVDCRRRHKFDVAAKSVVDDADWRSLTLGRTRPRCHCRCAARANDKAAVVGDCQFADDHSATDGVRHKDPLTPVCRNTASSCSASENVLCIWGKVCNL